MRTFHTGGVAGSDITQGLPRVEELFEARKPKTMAMLSEIAGKVSIEEVKNNKVVTVTSNEGGELDERSYVIPYGVRVRVTDGQEIAKGGEMTEGWANPHDILEILGTEAVQNYLIKEVQRVYRLQGVDINDKHIEVIVRQMMKKIRVADAGDTDILAGRVVDRSELDEANAKVRARIAAGEEGLREAVGEQTLLGITKASLATDSFLSAASFQETTRVLTEAAICGKSDPLIGLKENVIIGKLIPAGTGLKQYREVDLVEKVEKEPEIIDVEY
jgi:DNA-directed RNA polymerase subunit beta'